MGDLVFQSGILTFIGILIGAIAFGAVVGFLIRNRRSLRLESTESTSTDENLYLAFSRISHHLKSSGEIVRGHLRGFSEELPGDAERWRVARRTIFDEATQISTLVERLDILVRIGMTDEPLVMEPVNIPGLIEELMMGLAPAADEKGIVLGSAADASGAAQSIVSGDQSALREVFSNILENAVTHGGAGSEVTAELRSSNGVIKVLIRDTGSGMDDTQLRNLFKPGNRDHTPGIRRGTGMGLYLSKMLVELHGGTINASSKPGEGTAFSIELPLKKVAG